MVVPLAICRLNKSKRPTGRKGNVVAVLTKLRKGLVIMREEILRLIVKRSKKNLSGTTWMVDVTALGADGGAVKDPRNTIIKNREEEEKEANLEREDHLVIATV